MKVSYYSLGCKVNLYESEAVINQFVDHGFDFGDFDDVCDVYIINTCSITEVSDAKSRKIIRQAIKRNPEAVVAVMGCYAQLKPHDIKAIEGVDVIVGTNNRHLLFDLVIDSLENKNPTLLVDDIFKVKQYEDIKLKRYNNKTRGFVKIQDGCNNFCSYCTIPYARGTVRSRKHEDILEEIQILTDQGMKEIILTGINTASYGVDFRDYDFGDLLIDIVTKIKGLGRVRISSIEVTEVSNKILKIINDYRDKFCHHFHIPLQGGTDKTLERMNRKYNLDFYREKIKKIQDIFPDVNITTDVLTGFAGETDEDFTKTCDFIKEMGYGELHVFPYSRRPETRAYNYPDQVSEITKHLRVNELLKINNELALKYREKFLGQVVEVIVERVGNKIGYGHSSNYLEVEFTGVAHQNDLVKVKITEIGYPISKGVLV